MKTVKVTPDNIISVIDVNFDDFRDLQKAVGGHFEIVSTKTLYETFKMPMIMLVDEDGIMKQKEVNRLGSYFYDADRHGWPILGDIVLKSIGIDSELAAEKTKDCDAAEIDADNTVSTKTFEIGLTDAHVTVSADRTDLVTLETINGERYIMVKADGDINANGIILENREGEKDEEEDD